jgi:DNA polymerase type B, organellar and viral
MYIPYGENVHHYDVTSEYPTVMKNCLMPYKVTNFFRGDLIKNRPDLWESKLGFYRAIVFCPTYIQHPILPYLLDGKCVYPAGWFEGIFNSSELKVALKLGYHIEILEGYLFDGEYLFKDFITDMFETKNSLPSSDPMYALSKLSMNSLYGKFGMATDLSSYFVFNKSDPLPPV